MKKLLLIIFISYLPATVVGQQVIITADSLLHHLQQAENVYACFDYYTKDTVVNHFYDYEGLYFNDTLRHLLVDLFNDSIGWARHTAKVVRQNLENEPEENKRMALHGYLKRNYNKSFADSVLNNKQLFAQYFDSLCAYEEESSFERNFKKGSAWNLPNSFTNIIAHSHYPEVYDKMLYYWKNHKGANCEDYLLNVECPEMIADIEHKLDNNELTKDLMHYITQYRSESIRLLIKSLDKTYLVPSILAYPVVFDIPINVCLIGKCMKSYGWIYLEGYVNVEIDEFYGDFEILSNISFIYDIENIKTQKDAIKMSKRIIENKKLLLPFLELHYQNSLKRELYWKQNMPYYKKE